MHTFCKDIADLCLSNDDDPIWNDHNYTNQYSSPQASKHEIIYYHIHLVIISLPPIILEKIIYYLSFHHITFLINLMRVLVYLLHNSVKQHPVSFNSVTQFCNSPKNLSINRSLYCLLESGGLPCCS